ncbi:7-carboxy-7-deazaguanine synthase [Streptomyces sp. 111WW2]|uniref:7-carboxy-7-deazaguanine synthase QueE n=1 Tax=unclassified Streptomyces TaxID=2593676 RepID=UPI000D0C78B2|nr:MULTISPECIES: 7-carboxy-7-deazaguanine synthase QueE [unclassified Streptomyces]MDX3402546.1 7-carboxy-7-deazaguanine synthase QueE [Streptomyces sp. ME01-18h]PSK58420.1 7-carboxy-7-deazaguanine synthase [Streptomyces sp. 111WW2]
MTTPEPVTGGPTAGDAEFRLIVAECFGAEVPTFQGEGPSCGHPALFIRLSRCNLTCTKCDTKYTWDWSQFDPRKESTKRTVADLMAWAESSPVELVVITGGEPLIQQTRLVPLVRGLIAAGKRVEFETNGTIAPAPELVVDGVRFNVSPKLASFGVKEAKSLVPAALEAFAASERAAFKFVASTVADLDRIAELADTHRLAPVWVMPEGATTEAITATTRVLADAVAARRWYFTTRLHVLAFADARGR